MQTFLANENKKKQNFRLGSDTKFKPKQNTSLGSAKFKQFDTQTLGKISTCLAQSKHTLVCNTFWKLVGVLERVNLFIVLNK